MKLAACLLCAVAMGGCASAPVFRMSSLEPGLREVRLRELERRDPGEVSVIASFDRVWEGLVVFRVTIANRSESRVGVDPAGFFVTLASSPTDSLTGGEPVHSAVRPGALVALAAGRLDQERSAQAVGAFFGFLSVVAEAAAEFTRDGHPAGAHDDECFCCREAREREEAERSEREALAAQGRLERLSEQQAFWEANVLRPSVLEPWGKADGMVAFRADPLLQFRPKRRANVASGARAVPASGKTFGLVLHCPVGDSTRRVRFAVYRY